MNTLRNALPQLGVCPVCGQEFHVVGRTGTAMPGSDATDVLEWQCLGCRHRESETRRLADGLDGDWPVSKFDARNALIKPS